MSICDGGLIKSFSLLRLKKPNIQRWLSVPIQVHRIPYSDTLLVRMLSDNVWLLVDVLKNVGMLGHVRDPGRRSCA